MYRFSDGIVHSIRRIQRSKKKIAHARATGGNAPGPIGRNRNTNLATNEIPSPSEGLQSNPKTEVEVAVEGAV